MASWLYWLDKIPVDSVRGGFASSVAVWFGSAALLIGIAYVLIVLYLPYGIVGTWRAKSPRVKQGREWLGSLFSGDKPTDRE